jgi:hypothetical protein
MEHRVCKGKEHSGVISERLATRGQSLEDRGARLTEEVGDTLGALEAMSKCALFSLMTSQGWKVSLVIKDERLGQNLLELGPGEGMRCW